MTIENLSVDAHQEYLKKIDKLGETVIKELNDLKEDVQSGRLDVLISKFDNSRQEGGVDEKHAQSVIRAVEELRDFISTSHLWE